MGEQSMILLKYKYRLQVRMHQPKFARTRQSVTVLCCCDLERIGGLVRGRNREGRLREWERGGKVEPEQLAIA